MTSFHILKLIRPIVLAVIFIIAIVTPFQLWSQSIGISSNGKTEYVILLPNKPDSNEVKAAKLLSVYFKKITGADFPIQHEPLVDPAHFISIGPTKVWKSIKNKNPQSLVKDGFIIRTANQNIFLYGGSRNGIVYAATALLEDWIGCRKWNAEEEYIPSVATLALPEIDSTYLPVADIRIVNGPMAEDPAVKAWRRVTTISDDWREGEWKGYYVHTFNRLVPPAIYFDRHPEYFGLINGQRKAYAQLCLTNPEVLKMVIDTLRKEMAMHPGIQYWSVSQNDDFEYCRCANCAKVDAEEGAPSGLILRFVNQVAAAFPEKTITTLAYSYTRHAPKITRPVSNVMITLCSIEMDRAQPIAESNSGKSFVQDLREWHAISNNIMIWDYEVQFTNFISPFPLFHTLQPNLRLFHQYGVRADFQQCYVERGVEFAPLKLYVLSKLLWNPEIDVDAVVNDFMSKYYGPAGVYLKKYFDMIHQDEIRTNQPLDIYGTPVAFSSSLLTTERMNEYKLIFEEAEKSVSDDPILVNRVKIARLPLIFAEMEIAKSDLFGNRGWFKREGSKFLINPDKTALLDTFRSVCGRNNIVSMNENGLFVNNYCDATLRFIDVSVEGNLAFEKSVTCSPAPDPRYIGKGPGTLTNGVKGTENYKINWLGWEGINLSCTIDLNSLQKTSTASISTLHYPKSWIIHPKSISCLVSTDNINFVPAGTMLTNPDLTQEPMLKTFTFNLPETPVRYIRFDVEASKTLPAWHTYAGEKSWVFIDEIVVK